MTARTYHHGDLRRALLDAVAEQVEEGGVASVSLRGVARRVGVSHAAPAHHFRDKRALLTAFARQGQQRLADTLAEADATDTTTTERLTRLGVAYARFAVAHPTHFAVMYRLDVIDDDDPMLRAVAQPSFDRLRDAVVAHQATGWRWDHDPELLAVMVWAQVHGLAQLWLGGFVAPELRGGGVEALATDMVATLVRPDPPAPSGSPGQP